MSKLIIKTDSYAILVKDIAELYSRARKALVESYWHIGKRIVEQEQQGDGKAGYGLRLLEHLSEDLQHKLGSGFSKRNLYRMREFYLGHSILPTSAELNWSQYVELLPITNKADKRRLEKRIISDKLSPRQIRQEVRQLKESKQRPPQGKTRIVLPQPRREQPLQCFELIAPERAPCSKGRVLVDCGFNLWREIPRQAAKSHGHPSYSYPAKVESVIDADTLWVILD